MIESQIQDRSYPWSRQCAERVRESLRLFEKSVSIRASSAPPPDRSRAHRHHRLPTLKSVLS